MTRKCGLLVVLTEVGPVEIDDPRDRDGSLDRRSWPSGSDASRAWRSGP